MADPNIEQIRTYAKAILNSLPPEEPKGDASALLLKMKELLPNIDAPPWYLSEVEESGEGYQFLTFGPHEPPHYEMMVAQFFPGNFGTQSAEMALLLFNNLELIVAVLEKAGD